MFSRDIIKVLYEFLYVGWGGGVDRETQMRFSTANAQQIMTLPKANVS